MTLWSTNVYSLDVEKVFKDYLFAQNAEAEGKEYRVVASLKE